MIECGDNFNAILFHSILQSKQYRSFRQTMHSQDCRCTMTKCMIKNRIWCFCLLVIELFSTYEKCDKMRWDDMTWHDMTMVSPTSQKLISSPASMQARTLSISPARTAVSSRLAWKSRVRVRKIRFKWQCKMMVMAVCERMMMVSVEHVNFD